LSVVIGKERTFPGNAVDIRRLISDNSMAIRANVRNSDVVAKNHQDVWLRGLRWNGRGPSKERKYESQNQVLHLHFYLCPFSLTGVANVIFANFLLKGESGTESDLRAVGVSCRQAVPAYLIYFVRRSPLNIFLSPDEPGYPQKSQGLMGKTTA
jgi:hypothetical protein